MKEWIRSHKTLLEAIKSFNESKDFKLIRRGSLLDGLDGTIKPYRKAFSITFNDRPRSGTRRRLEIGQYHKQVALSNEVDTYVAKGIYLRRNSYPEFEGDVDVLYSKGFSHSNRYYFRLVIPLKQKMTFYNRIEDSIYKSDLSKGSSRGLVSANINGSLIDACQIKYDNRHYLIVECRSKVNIESFRHMAYAFQLAIGYMLGHFASDKGYFFAYTNKNMERHKYLYFSELRDSIYSSYEPICANPHAYAYKRRHMAKKLYDKKVLRTLKTSELSILAERIYGNREFASVIILVLESSGSSLLLMPGGYSIALEMLSDIIIGSAKVDIKPIQDKDSAVRDAIVKDCIKIIKEHCKPIVADTDVLITKIHQINRSTNANRLKAPFKILDITIDKEDFKILNTRNDFLHGRHPDLFKLGPSRDEKQISKEMYYSSVRLYTLLNMLILKWIGYDNRVINHAKHQEDFTKMRLPDEELFRVV